MDDQRRHLALVGMMGSGKSTVGKRVARRLHRAFIDVDDCIETQTGRTIADLFAGDGESTFRELERDELARSLVGPEPAVIATGGGAILDAGTRELLGIHALTVWLRADPAVLAGRLKVDGSRPLIEGNSPGATIARLLKERESFYSEVADEIIDVDTSSRERIVRRLVEFAEASETHRPGASL